MYCKKKADEIKDPNKQKKKDASTSTCGLHWAQDADI